DLEGITPSIGTVGDAYDNALMETVNGLFKAECIRTTIFHAGPYRTLADVEFATAGGVGWYNHRRLHSSLGMLTPVEFAPRHNEARSRVPGPTKERQGTWDGAASFDGGGSADGRVEAINGRLEHLRGIALGFRNGDRDVLRCLLHCGQLATRINAL